MCKSLRGSVCGGETVTLCRVAVGGKRSHCVWLQWEGNGHTVSGCSGRETVMSVTSPVPPPP